VHSNIDYETVKGFGYEWGRFDQSELPPEEAKALFNAYFSIFPWECLPEGAVGFDLGCGSGRWARFVAPRVARLYCVDASRDALRVARENLADFPNCEIYEANVDRIPIQDSSMDFGYSLGVLHHVPDTLGGLKSCVEKLKPAAPFLVYLYYAFDNRPFWFRLIWRASDIIRRQVSGLPCSLRYWISQTIALFIYFPIARVSLALAKMGIDVRQIPLSFYRDKSLYVIRTDALDRFGTKLEQRFTKGQIRLMMENVGLERIRFSDYPPYWCAMGFKRK
jgi:SAM-dependent methyltransferase